MRTQTLMMSLLPPGIRCVLPWGTLAWVGGVKPSHQSQCRFSKPNGVGTSGDLVRLVAEPRISSLIPNRDLAIGFEAPHLVSYL